MKKYGIALYLWLAVLLVFTVSPALALDDDEFGGYAADTLTIKVGYFGGPYYEKAVFTLDELWAMEVVYADYTFIDNMPSVVIDHVAGVRLADLMEAAGVDLNSVHTFFFWTRDKSSDYYTSYPKAALIDTPRYCYYSLPDNFDAPTGRGNEYAALDAVYVDTVLSLADDWNRVIAGASFGSDYLDLNTNTRFRLIFGQTDTYERTAARSAKWIHEIVVELGGAPTLILDASALEGEVGSVLRTSAAVSADAAVMAHEAVVWSSSDDSIAAVDAEGNITVKSVGTAVITATFAGVSAAVTVNGSPGQAVGTEWAAADPASPSADSAREPLVETALNETEQPNAMFELFAPETPADAMEGGVQNWRVFEMSETATALPNIELDNPLLGFTLTAAAGLFAGAAIIYAFMFYINVKGKRPYVYKHKLK